MTDHTYTAAQRKYDAQESPDFTAAAAVPIGRLTDRAISVGMEALASDCYTPTLKQGKPPTAEGMAFMELLRTNPAEAGWALANFVEKYANENPADCA
jgi:hypothetical protein